ncbi:hypothetical protein C8J57DRAFT_1528369 [Mycena rebaudengoi]|nr:hypothetical protein C8J57DRAFT_1528369 [Mycena rebaudengoi]
MTQPRRVCDSVLGHRRVDAAPVRVPFPTPHKLDFPPPSTLRPPPQFPDPPRSQGHSDSAKARDLRSPEIHPPAPSSGAIQILAVQETLRSPH